MLAAMERFVDGFMDHKAQKDLDAFVQLFMYIAATVFFIWGYVQQDFGLTCKGILYAAGVCMVLCVPNWGIFKNDPNIKWLPDGSQERPASTPLAKKRK